MKRFVSGGVVALLCSGAAWGADGQGGFAIKGAGAATCRKFAEHRAADSRDFYVFAGWIDGYLTAHNRHARETYDGAPWQATETLAGMLDTYCKKHPDEPFAGAVAQLVETFALDRVSARSELVRAEVGGKGVMVYQEVLRRAQAALARLGHYKGKPDEAFGAPTQKALEAFQRATKIPPTGLPDQQTLYELFRK